MSQEKIILGIDPGTNVMGYGIIEVAKGKIRLLECNVLKLKSTLSHEVKLKKIFERVTELIEEFIPDEIALEAPFYGKNVQSMLKLGRAQGVAMAAALVKEIPIKEYAPKKIKQSITGNGNASKEQVAAMLHTILPLKLKTTLLDATDALAVAICHHFHGIGGKTKSKKTWESFIQENPNRIKK